MAGEDHPIGDGFYDRTEGCECGYCTGESRTSLCCHTKWDALPPESRQAIGESADD